MRIIWLFQKREIMFPFRYHYKVDGHSTRPTKYIFFGAQNQNQEILTELFSGEATSLLSYGISYFSPLIWQTFHFSSNFNILSYVCQMFFVPGKFRSWKEASWYQKEYSRYIRYHARPHFSKDPKSVNRENSIFAKLCKQGVKILIKRPIFQCNEQTKTSAFAKINTYKVFRE